MTKELPAQENGTEDKKICNYCGDLCITNQYTLSPMCAKTECIKKGIDNGNIWLLNFLNSEKKG